MTYQKLDKFKLPKGFRGKNVFIVQLWWAVQATLFAMSPQFAYSWRNFLLRIFGARVGNGVIVRPSARVTYPWKLKLGNNSWIGDNVVLYSLDVIDIGSNVVVSQSSYLCTGSHSTTLATFDIYSKPIVVRDECWIATDVFIAPGIEVGKGAVIGARSSVFNNIPAGTICFGTPAKPIKQRHME